MPVFDKYAPYVLSAYGIAALVLAGLVVWSVLRVVNARRKLDRIEPNKDDAS